MIRSIKGAWLKRKYGSPVIVVSGLPRSGTSMLMKMLDAGGLELVTDNIRTADEDNPKGYFELEAVKNLDKTTDKSWLTDCRGKVVKIISFLLKNLLDTCYYKVIFVRRNLDEVIASQNKMLARRGEPVDEASDAKMIQNYRMHLRKIEYLLKDSPNIEHIDVHYRQVVDQPREQARKIGKFLGRKFDLDRVAGVVDKNLYRNRC